PPPPPGVKEDRPNKSRPEANATFSEREAIQTVCYNTLLEEGEKAMLVADQHSAAPTLEPASHSNKSRSGVGF
ncbi:hypothetical protein ACQJ0S_27235, partial [Klebsiella pneumoniae]